MSQLDRIEAMLKELVRESRKRRVQEECDRYANEQQCAVGPSAEQRQAIEDNHKWRLRQIMEGED